MLRTAAALAVVLTHSFAVSGHGGERPLAHVGRFPLAFGQVGVYIFFVISGFLVATSWDRVGRVTTFARNRFARIWPGLITVVMLSVFVVGPLVTTLSVQSYFASRLTSGYLVRNIVLLRGPVYHLPGVFGGQPTAAVNASLWTLPYEIWAYVGVVLLGVTGALRRFWVPAALLVAGCTLFRFGIYTHHISVRYTALAVGGKHLFALGTLFLAGVLLSRFVERIDLRRAAIPGVLLIVLSFVVREPVLFFLGLAATVIGLGVRDGAATDAVHRLGDPSYGIYIFSFPIQQLLFKAGVADTPWVMLAWSAPISVAAGYLSWHVVEHPALRWFKRSRRAAPADPEPGSPGAAE